MKTPPRWCLFAMLVLEAASAGAGPPDPPPEQAPKLSQAPATAQTDRADSEERAKKRYEEMLNRMQASVEEIAEMYGNPVFLQVFTNDEGRASELKLRLRTAKNSDEIAREMSDLQKRRDDLLNDIALKARESARLAEKLARQRAALDALAAAVEDARKAVEDTSK